METVVWSDYTDSNSSGELAVISAFPEREPNIDRPSLYPFQIELDSDEDSSWKSGNHVSMLITLDEALDVTVVSQASIAADNGGQFVYVLTGAGTIEKRSVETGISAEGKLAVLNGLEPGEIIISEAAATSIENGTAFITP